MIRFVVRRLLVLILRLGAAAGLLLLLIEFSFGVLGARVGDGDPAEAVGASAAGASHVWEMTFSGEVPSQISVEDRGAWGVLADRALVSARSVAIAVASIWIIGYGWGILGARFRGLRADFALQAPFVLAASLPGFWVVTLVAVYSYLVWERPGFAGELQVETGPDLLGWWNASVVALPLVLAGAVSQMRGVSDALQRSAAAVASTEYRLLGYRDEDIFHRRIRRGARRDLVAQIDRAVPLILGGLIVTEWAFRQEGVGALLVEAIRLRYLPGVFLAAMALALLPALFAFLRECVVEWIGKEAA